MAQLGHYHCGGDTRLHFRDCFRETLLAASPALRMLHCALSMSRPNPALDFGIDKSTLRYIGSDLQRPECILAERDGTLWSADAGRCGANPAGRLPVARHAKTVGSVFGRFVGGQPISARHDAKLNGMAFAREGDFLIPNLISEPTVWKR